MTQDVMHSVRSSMGGARFVWILTTCTNTSTLYPQKQQKQLMMPTLTLNPSEASSSPSVLSSQNTASSGTSSALYYHSGHGILRNLISSVLSSRSRHPQGLHVTDLESTPCLDAKSAFTTEGTRELLSQIQVTMTWEHRIRLPAITCYNRCLEALKATEAEPLSPVEFSFSLVWRHDLFQRQEHFILLSPPLRVHLTGPVHHLTKRPPLRKADSPEAKLR